MRNWILALALAAVWLLPEAAVAALACGTTTTATCGTQWTLTRDGTSAPTKLQSQDAFWAFDAPGESPMLTSKCSKASFQFEEGGTSTEIHPYTCTGSDFATQCRRVEGRNQGTGIWGSVVLSDNDPFLVSVAWRSFVFQVQSGTPAGVIRAYCED
jgi:hypothetical protein